MSTACFPFRAHAVTEGCYDVYVDWHLRAYGTLGRNRPLPPRNVPDPTDVKPQGWATEKAEQRFCVGCKIGSLEWATEKAEKTAIGSLEEARVLAGETWRLLLERERAAKAAWDFRMSARARTQRQ